MRSHLLLCFGLWATSVRAHGGARTPCACPAPHTDMAMCTCAEHRESLSFTTGHTRRSSLLGLPRDLSQSCRRPTHVDAPPGGTTMSTRPIARRCETCYGCVCSRTQQLLHSHTAQFNYYKPSVIIGERDGSDSAPSDAIVCNGRGRGGVVAQVKAGETLGALPSCAVPKHRTRLQAPRHTAALPQCAALRARSHCGGAAPGRLCSLRFVRWRRRARRGQAVSQVMYGS